MLGCFSIKAEKFYCTNCQLGLPMLNPNVVFCAGSFSHHAVDMHSLSEYYNLYGYILSFPKCFSSPLVALL